MRRRQFIAGLGSAAAWPLAVSAQQPALPVIGLVSLAEADVFADDMRAFHKGLGEAGYVDGQNVLIVPLARRSKSRRAGANRRPYPPPRGRYRHTGNDGSHDRRQSSNLDDSDCVFYRRRPG